MKFQLSATLAVEVVAAEDGSRYLRLVRSRPNSRNRWLNISRHQWKIICSLVAELCAAATGLTADESHRDFAVSGSLHVRTSLFNELVYTGFCVRKAPFTNIINLNGDQWATLIVIMTNIDDALQGVSTTPKALRPPAIPRKRRNPVSRLELLQEHKKVKTGHGDPDPEEPAPTKSTGVIGTPTPTGVETQTT
jgi:hypothetical protein